MLCIRNFINIGCTGNETRVFKNLFKKTSLKKKRT